MGDALDRLGDLGLVFFFLRLFGLWFFGSLFHDRDGVPLGLWDADCPVEDKAQERDDDREQSKIDVSRREER